MADKHPDYWEIKAAYLQLELSRLEGVSKFKTLLVSKGIKPEGHFRFDDASQSIIDEETS